jgi:predicted ATPase
VTLQLDPESGGVLCMEEPENGMHPARIPALINLMRDYIVDPRADVGPDNPLRQVILNSHSPDVLRQLDRDEVLFVDTLDLPEGRCAQVSSIERTWRTEMPGVPIQRMADFLGGAPLGRAVIQLQLPLSLGTAR